MIAICHSPGLAAEIIVIGRPLLIGFLNIITGLCRCKLLPFSNSLYTIGKISRDKYIQDTGMTA